MAGAHLLRKGFGGSLDARLREQDGVAVCRGFDSGLAAAAGSKLPACKSTGR